MKKIAIVILLAVMSSCASSSPSNSVVASNTLSPEAEARKITDQMKSALNLDSNQEDKILMVNVVNLKVIRKLKETQDHQLINDTRAKYKTEVQNILNADQFNKFVSSFPEL